MINGLFLRALSLGFAVAAVNAAVACSSQHTNAPANAPSPNAPASRAGETPLPTESSPPGDIPDTQAFVSYASSAGRFVIDAPEGWSRVQSQKGITFTDKFNGESVFFAPQICGSRDEAAALADSIKREGGAATDISIKAVTLPAGHATYASYAINSAPEPVTGKRVKLGANAYLIHRGGRCALLTLWAPLGADNVDQWRRIARSFRWL